MTPTERSPHKPSAITRISAALRALLPIKGTGVYLGVIVVVSALTALSISAAPALAEEGHIYEKSFGEKGSGAGELSLTPLIPEYGHFKSLGSGLAVNEATGDVYVADTGNRRVDAFESDGTFLDAWGWGVNAKEPREELQLCTVATGCLAARAGSKPGEFEDPVFIAVDNDLSSPSHGDVYVADAGDTTAGDDVVSKFTEAGLLVSSWGVGGQLHQTPVRAEGTGDLTEGSAEGSGELTTGSPVVTNVKVSAGVPVVGQQFASNALSSKLYVTAVGAGTITLSAPIGALEGGVTSKTERFSTESNFVAALTASSGAFERGQTISGEGIPAGTLIKELSGGGAFLSAATTKAATGVALSARFVFGGLAGIAVDDSGNLWVADKNSEDVFEFAPEGAFTRNWPSPKEVGLSRGSLALNSAGDLYYESGTGPVEVTSAGKLIGVVENSPSHGGRVTGLAVDPFAGDLYVDSGVEGAPGVEVKDFPASCEPALGFCVPAGVFGGSEEPEAGRLSDAQGLAVGPGGVVYAADVGAGAVFAYKQVTLPELGPGPVSALTQGTATVSASVDPDGVKLVECVFEYGTTAAYGLTPVPCEYEYEHGKTTTDPAEIPTGLGAVEVRAKLSGLGASPYHFRLSVRNEAAPEHTRHDSDGVFGASVDSSTVQSTGYSTATLGAEIDPDGLAASCELQYVDEAGFLVSQFTGASTVPCEPASLAAGQADQGVAASLTGLSPGTTYRFRFLSTVGAHATDGPTATFYTYSPLAFSPCENEALRTENTSLELPDCRAYEQVSPPGSGEVYVPQSPDPPENGVGSAEEPMGSSAGGDTVAYVGEGTNTGLKGGGNGDEHLATRGANGWGSVDIQPAGSSVSTQYEGFAGGLSLAILKTGTTDESLPPGLVSGCLNSYSAGSYHALASRECGEPFYVGASSSGADLLFESTAVLVKGAEPSPEPQPEPKSNPPLAQEGHDNVYLSAGGTLRLVNVLPGASPLADPDATAGALSGEPALSDNGAEIPAVDAGDVISGDGSRVFWTDLETGVVYLRENAGEPQSKVNSVTGKCTAPAEACTVQVSGGSQRAEYWTATPDGHYAYYTENGELWRYDSETEERKAIAAGAGAKVQGVVGVNETGEDGSYLYFVAEGALAPGAEARTCTAAQPQGSSAEREEATLEAEGEAPTGRGCNLYLAHGGVTTLVVTLLPGDNNFKGAIVGYPQPKHGVWPPVLGYHAAQLTPEGKTLVFMSERRLTSYDNLNGAGKCSPEGGSTHSCSEVYVYDAESNAISCASCAPSGAAPEGAIFGDRIGTTTFLPYAVSSITHTPRLISADGSRVFFDSAESLLPASTGGHEGVYEWERKAGGSESTNTCAGGSPYDGGGCLYLLSGAATATVSASPSYLIEANQGEGEQAGGENVFFVTRGQLTPTDRGEAGALEPVLYDARVDGGFPLPAEDVPPPICKNTEECRSTLTEPPAEPFPATTAFSGAGNLISPPPPPPPPPVKSLTNAQKLAAALKACRKDRSKQKRARCETSARKKYSPKKTKKPSHKRRAK